MTGVAPAFSKDQIDRLLRPQSIAILGASPEPDSLGARVLANLEASGYAGALHLINPKRREVGCRPCAPSVEELPEGIDCAVLAVPRSAVFGALSACARRRMGAAIIFSAGFAEAGDAGRAEQQKIRSLARESGMVVEGPNCLGMVNHVDGVPLTFVGTKTRRPEAGEGVALISQSGAVAAVLEVSLRNRGLRLSFSISTGNEAATGVEDFLEYLIEDEHTRVLALVVEQFREPRRLLKLVASALQAGKRMVLLHPGSSGAARAAAATHTGAMTANYDVMRAKVRHAGVLMVDTLEELVDAAEILVRCPVLPRGGAAVYTESGLFKALALDYCERQGLPLPPLPGNCAEALRRALPDFIQPGNPLDLTAQGLVDPELYRRTLAPVLEEEQFGTVILAIILTDRATAAFKFKHIIAALKQLRPVKPVIFASMDEGAEASPDDMEELRALGVPCFPTVERAFRAVALISAWTGTGGEPAETMPGQIDTRILEPGVIPEHRAKRILSEAGIPVPPGALAKTVEQALDIANGIGFPVVLKAQAADLPHKTDAGGVALNLRNPLELAAAWEAMLQAVAASKPGLLLDGILVESMGRPGVELIAGARRDPDWGPVLLVGFGGVWAEAFHDVRLLPSGISRDAIAREVLAMKSGALLKGLRGAPEMDIEAAADLIWKLGRFVEAAPGIREIEMNPLVAYPKGQGAVALDALMVVD